MRVPQWLTIAIAVLVMIFGGYRLWLAWKLGKQRPEEEGDRPRRGFYRTSKKMHLVVGAMYVVLGGALIATSFGFNPFRRAIGPDTVTPTKDTAPSTSVPIDQLPKP